MTIAHWLSQATKYLSQAGVDAPRTDALVLLETVLQKDRAWVLSHAENEITKSQLEQLTHLLQQRTAHMPLAYITQKAWFYGRQFNVNSHVLIPRPESEDIITLVKNHTPDQIIDIGTGSGCLAITSKLELPKSAVFAVDISTGALRVARQNAQMHDTNITFIKSDLLENIAGLITDKTALLVNLPYVPEALITSPEITAEPEIALFSGDDGMQHYTAFWQQIQQLQIKPNVILTESLTDQHDNMTTLAATTGYALTHTERLIQEFIIQ